VIVEEKTEVNKNTRNSELRTMELGFRLMPTVSSVDFTTHNGEVVRGEATVSMGYGGLLGINFSKNVGILAEVDYNEVSQKYKDRGLEREVQITYLNIPVMLSLNTDKTRPVNLNLVAGPQFGLNIGSSVKTAEATGETDTLHAVIAVKEGDVGFAYGAGLEFALNPERTIRFDLGFRGFYGLVDMTSDQVNNNPNTYNIMIRAGRKTYAGYGGITFAF
jgi:opacity protein-like surface antigen